MLKFHCLEYLEKTKASGEVLHISGHSWSQLIMHQTQSNRFIIQTLMGVKGGAIKNCTRKQA